MKLSRRQGNALNVKVGTNLSISRRENGIFEKPNVRKKEIEGKDLRHLRVLTIKEKEWSMVTMLIIEVHLISNRYID